MGRALFYHLTQAALEPTVATLCSRALGAGWRVAIRGRQAERLEKLDLALWTDSPASFLPHGLAGGPHDADQPILLTLQPHAANQPQAVMAIDQAAIAPAEVAGLERLWLLFEASDPAAMEHARAQWRAMVAAGVTAEYWSDADGRWQKKFETGAS